MALKKWTNEGLGLVESLDVELAGPDEPDEKRVAALVGGQVAVCELMMSEHAGDMAAREDVIARITEMDPDVVSREVGTTTAHERNLFDAVRQRALSDSRLSASMLSRTGELLSRHGPEMIGASQWDALASSQSRLWLLTRPCSVRATRSSMWRDRRPSWPQHERRSPRKGSSQAGQII